MTEQKTILTTYLQRVLALKDERRTLPSPEELREIARELGLSETDLAAVEQAAEDHFLRGQGFLERRRWDDAIVELEEAVAVSPRSVERRHALAAAHAGKWQESHEASSRDRAEKLARECLELDPRHGESFEVLERLGPAQATPHPRPRPKTALALSLAGLALVGILTLKTLRSEPMDRESGDHASAIVEEPAVTEGPTSSPAPQDAASPQGEVEELNIPASLDLGSTGLDLELEIRQSRLKNYATGKSFVTLNALLANVGASEIDKLGARLVLSDTAGGVIQQDAFDVLTSSSPVLRPGDRHAIHLLRETSPELRDLRLVIETVDQNPAAAAYAPAKTIPLDWPSDRPSDLDVTLRQRSYRYAEKSLPKDGTGYFNTVLEIENTSQRTLRQLVLQVEILGPEEQWTAAHEGHVVLSSGPALRPGEVRLKRLFHRVEGQPESYRMSVVSVQ